MSRQKYNRPRASVEGSVRNKMSWEINLYMREIRAMRWRGLVRLRKAETQ
jgi:hypothetical protein